MFWDASLDPEPLHGVTTMLVGNCSLSLFPVNERTRGDVADLFAYIEDVPRHLFDDSVPWTWTDYAGYRDAVNSRGIGTNLAALMGHSPLRLVVMGDEAWTRAATADEITAMAAILDEAMVAGAWGLSTSFLDVDQNGRPVCHRAPPRTTSSTRCSMRSRAAAAASWRWCPVSCRDRPRFVSPSSRGDVGREAFR